MTRRVGAGGTSQTAAGAGTDLRWSPGGKPPGNRLALALTLGAHLLAAMFWWQERRPRPDPVPDVVTIQLQALAPAHAPAPAPTRPPTRQHPQHTAAERARASPGAPPAPAHRVPAFAPPPLPLPLPLRPPAAAKPSPASAAPAASAATSATPLAPGDAAASAPGAATSAANAANAANAAGGSFAVGLARRQAGRIDRELRGGKSGVPLEADTPWARFQRGIEAAHVDPSHSARFDSYTSPDGVVIYRERVGGRTFCRRSGSVGLGIAGAGGVNDAGPVSCPTGVTWERDD